MPRANSTGALPTGHTWPDHPLFPVDEGETNPEVAFIQVTRIDRGMQVYGPVLRADELTTTDELFELYGGGHYELWARGMSKSKLDSPGNISRRRRFQLPGRSKPLSKDPTADEIRQAEGVRPAPADASPAPPASSSGLGGGSEILLAMMQMQQQNAQQFAQMMATMLASSKAESTEMAKLQAQSQSQMTTLLLTMSGQQTQSMMSLVTALLSNRGSGPEEMAKYAKLLKDLGVAGAGGAKEDGEGEGVAGIGKLVEDAADAIQGLVMLKGGAPAPSSAPVEGAPAAPGSAAAVAASMLPKT